MRNLLLLPALSAIAASAQVNVAAGAVRYRLYCAECHGRKGLGGRGPDLVSGRWTHGSSDAEIARTIAKGVSGTAMTGFGELFDEHDIRELVSFMRSLAVGAPVFRITGEASRGREIFWGKGACGSCHNIAGRGGRFGPDLTRIASQRSLASIKESIVSPSAAIAEGYQGVSASPRAGAAVTGVRRNEDNFTVQIFDFSEKYHSFRKSDLASLQELRDSLMPPAALSAAEVDDLVAYLDTMRGKP